jgi:hypothetical protein
MKRITALLLIFVLAFAGGVGIVLLTSDTAQARPPAPLPCHPDNIYCTSIPCGTYPRIGGIFYCYPDFQTEYCSGDWYPYPVPCSHIM